MKEHPLSRCTFTPEQARQVIARFNDPTPPRDRYVLGARHREAPDLHAIERDYPGLVAAVVAAMQHKPTERPCQRKCFSLGLRERHELRGICPCQRGAQ